MTQEQISDVLRSAIERQVPVTVTLKRDSGWTSCHTRLLAVHDPHILLGDLLVHEGDQTPQIHPAEKIGLSFKLKHYKHIFTVTAVGNETIDGVSGLSVCLPNSMHRLQRRAFIRAEVPHGRVVRASFWLGGRDNEPTHTDPDQPVWSGMLTNISAGGFQLVAGQDAEDWDIEVGETVGVRLAFEAGSESIYADAQFRRFDSIDSQKLLGFQCGQTLLGFQFVGLAQDRKGRQSLQYISAKVAEYHRHIEASGGRRR
jgi:c-di-GMP-binding flagellar brake protein YcgR